MPDTQSVKMPCEIRRIDLDGATFRGTHEHFEPTYGTGSTFQYDDGNQVRRRAMRMMAFMGIPAITMSQETIGKTQHAGGTALP